jgi:2-polyprenyl-3-methyl-5-hydroxy-6-metoxy-1,4-benzoquinol methylase
MNVSRSEVSQHYLRENGQEYVRQRQSDSQSPGYALNLRYFLPHLKPTDAVLDFGCGNGGMLRVMRPHVRTVEGLEVNAAAAVMARETGCMIYENLAALPAEPRYDIITSCHVLEHVRDVCSTLETLRRCLKPQGRFVALLPIDDIRARHQRRWSPHDIDRHLQTWTPRLFANVLYESGYDVQKCEIITSHWNPRLFSLARIGLDRLGYWLLAILLNRRQLLAVARLPQ